MEQVNIPEAYNQVMPYLIIPDAAGFIKFMEDVFDAKLLMKHDRDENVIMHAELQIGDCVVMLADSTEQFPPRTGAFFIYVDNADYRYNKALDAGAEVATPIADQSYGRSGGIKDPHGNTWWITTAVENKL